MLIAAGQLRLSSSSTQGSDSQISEVIKTEYIAGRRLRWLDRDTLLCLGESERQSRTLSWLLDDGCFKQATNMLVGRPDLNFWAG